MLREHYSIVALDNHMMIGFEDIDKAGYLDHLYVHKDYQRKGIATALCDKLEAAVQNDIVTHVSIAAKAFFEKRGYQTIKAQEVVRQGIPLTNFVMIKKR